MVGQCQHCGFEFDLRKRACPQCSVVHKPSKKELEEEEKFDINSPVKSKTPTMVALVEPKSPDIDREEGVKKQLLLAKEKRKLLLHKRQLVELETRLAETNAENDTIEAEMNASLVTAQKAADNCKPASAFQNGGTSGTTQKPLGGVGFSGFTATNQAGASTNQHQSQQGGAVHQLQQLFHAAGSLYTPQGALGMPVDPDLATSTLQVGLESVGLGLQALGLSGTSTSGSIGTVGAARSQQPACEQSSCYPATGNLLIGRENRLYASSTCGLQQPSRYCIVSHLEDKKKCFYCDSRQPYVPMMNKRSHRIENIVSSFTGYNDYYHQWWQAENGKENVYIQIDLEAEFHFTHLIMRFKTFRPSAMLVERSYDFGKTWKVYRYFAYDCASAFPGVMRGPIRNISDVICESRYSDVAPSSRGELIFRVLPPSIQIDNPYHEDVQDLLKMTNLRVNFTKLHTLGDDLLDNRDEIKEKYYYSVLEMVVRGSCSCYGHASRCVPLPNQDKNPNMVHGRCECTHNTKGLNCEQCEDFYNDLPWRPARGRETNACKMCECNNHADRCHFDPAVFELTGRVSGGVCDDCRHNTMGRNCEECKPFYYQDPARDIRDPHVCQSCDCDPVGSEHGGECETRTDPFNDLVAGRCICKRFVEGPRCDMCMNGYWNLRVDSPEGCQACTCNTLGTVGNYGCDKRSGECRCKRYVTGRQCDQCVPSYWGMSDDIEGCKACDCDVGGALDNACDQNTGQCNCRPNIIGLRCDTPTPGFFVTDLDFYTYEAEFANGIGNTRVVIREPVPDRPVSWTGPGFMRVSEGDALEFTINDIPMSMSYDIVIRYEPQMRERWDDVRVKVIRPGSVDQRGVCANSIPQEDLKATSLPQVLENEVGSGDGDAGHGPKLRDYHVYTDAFGNTVYDWRLRGVLDFTGSRHYVVSPSSCLEKGVTYTIRLEFNRYRSDQSTPDASVLIDSIVLVPSVDSIPIFEGPGVPARMKEEFIHYRCRESQMAVDRPNPPDICQKYIFSIAAVMQQQAIDCSCDRTGSHSMECDAYGGQCQCKDNVIGRQCNQCSPGTYGFGPSGCSACNCNDIGSRDNFCDVQTGQCLCMPNVYGRQCDQCQRGYYNFPNCRPCNCNGRADTCDNFSGQCLECRDNTGGNNCNRCANGYYGDPSPNSPVGCRPCMCPGGAGSGYQHADTCSLDRYTNTVTCDCYAGYTGANCDRCDMNYYGNPRIGGGTCDQCTCNNNIDSRVPDSCDVSTGECLRCLFNTEGFNCERCSSGYFGDATQQNCQACICNLLGTDQGAGPCDRQTGQCPCLPSVVGLKCDTCAPNHWKIASGLGCDHCRCDPEGSVSDQCNQFDGQCDCRPGRGGRDCSECEANSWGDPDIQCFQCECNRDGSETMQCDRRTGQCECLPGVAGLQCDQCDRGTTGTLPYCVPCGECFDNWDRIIMELKEETDRLVNEGSQIKIGGAPGAFDTEFRQMEKALQEVKNITSGANFTSTDLDEIREKLSRLRKNLTDSNSEIQTLDKDLQSTTDSVETGNNRIEAIRRQVEALKKAAQELRANATNIRELDVGGAYNSTKESQRRSLEAQGKVQAAEEIVRQSESERTRVDDLLAANQAEFDRKYTENEQAIRVVDGDIESLDDKIVDLNEMVCANRGDPCDSLCGGAGCGKCGGLSCSQGAVTKASDALELAQGADLALKNKSEEASTLLNSVRRAQEEANMAKLEAQIAFDRSMEAKNQSEKSRKDLEDLISRISDFLGQKGARPADIRAVAQEVLTMSISLTPDQIRDLARQINETIRGLTDINSILEATREDLNKASRLKERADRAKGSADQILEKAKGVILALDAAKKAQDAAQSSIDQATSDITGAEDDLAMIESETSHAGETTRESMEQLDDLKSRLQTLKEQFVENDLNVKKAEDEADIAEELANRAEKNADSLETKYNEVSSQLDSKYNETQSVKIRVDTLREKASKLYQGTYEKIRRLENMADEFKNNEKVLIDISAQIAELNRKMIGYLTSIQEVARHHRDCTQA